MMISRRTNTSQCKKEPAPRKGEFHLTCEYFPSNSDPQGRIKATFTTFLRRRGESTRPPHLSTDGGRPNDHLSVSTRQPGPSVSQLVRRYLTPLPSLGHPRPPDSPILDESRESGLTRMKTHLNKHPPPPSRSLALAPSPLLRPAHSSTPGRLRTASRSRWACWSAWPDEPRENVEERRRNRQRQRNR